jgi:hypothetical protein
LNAAEEDILKLVEGVRLGDFVRTCLCRSACLDGYLIESLGARAPYCLRARLLAGRQKRRMIEGEVDGDDGKVQRYRRQKAYFIIQP